MKKALGWRWFSLCLLSLLPFLMTTQAARIEARYYVFDISEGGHQRLAALKNHTATQWWVEAGDRLLVYGHAEPSLMRIAPHYELPLRPETGRLYVLKKAHQNELTSLNADFLIDAGRSAIIQAHDDSELVLKEDNTHSKNPEHGLAHATLKIFQPNLVLAHRVRNEDFSKKATIDWPKSGEARLQALNEERWVADLTHLANYNRYTHGPQIAEATAWLKARFSEMPGLTVTEETFPVGSQMATNVVARLPGAGRPDDVYIVCGHYDSISEIPSTAAPGAEDNGSGTAGVLEMARLFTEFPPQATIIFIAFSGEEEGLHGSRAYVNQVVSNGDASKIKGVINMDMIGYARSQPLTVLLETEPIARELMETLQAAAAEFTDIAVETTFDAWGSDHVPFLNRDIPAVLTIDNDWSSYPDYHRTGDQMVNIVPAMAMGILRMNVGALSKLVD